MATDTPKSELLVPFLRSCKKETTEPVEGVIKGKIPEWINGSLIRNGPGLLKIGEDEYNHIFDSLSLLHRFSIQDGKVTYQNQFLRSDTYNRNMEANRIVTGEFGTKPSPDPCKTIFEKVQSFFAPGEFTDNCAVNIVKYTDEFYACTETNFIWKINPESLKSEQKVNLTDFVPIRMATAHAHEGRDGTVYNIGLAAGKLGSYAVIKFPPKETNSSNAFAGGSVISRIPATRSMYPSYHHSFGMSENFFVVLEQPLFLSVPKIFLKTIMGTTYAENLLWQPQHKTRFFVIRRDNGQILQQHYIADAFCTFHFINVFEEDDQLVVDICCYEDGSIINDLYVKALRDHVNNPKTELMPLFYSQAKRYILPLVTPEKPPEKGKNLVRIERSLAKAHLQDDGKIFCEPEILARPDPWYIELPRINYDFNGRGYRYIYAIGNRESDGENYLVKINTEDGTSLSWSELEGIPSEPVFVSDGSSDEDGGVIVASLLYKTDDKKVSLLVLDAKTMAELGRADFSVESSVTASFHGIFVKPN